MRADYDKYRSLTDYPDKAEVPKAADGIDLDALLEENLIWGQTGDLGDVTEEALDAPLSLVTAMGHNVPISEKRYSDLMCLLSDNVQMAQRELDATTR